MNPASPTAAASLREAGRDPAQDQDAKLRGAARRIGLNLVAPLALGYVLLLLDRSMAGFAAAGLEAPVAGGAGGLGGGLGGSLGGGLGGSLGGGLGMTALQLGLSMPILFLGILVFEVPSALVTLRLGARRWLASMLLVWAAAAVAAAMAWGPAGFLAARGVASVAQAGFFPVAVFLIASYAPAGFRTRLLSVMVLAALAAALVAQPVAGLVLRLDGVGGVAGWRWLFLLPAAPCVLLAAVVLRRLPDRVQDAGWLSGTERDALAWSRSVEPREKRDRTAWTALIDPRLLMLAAINFALSLAAFAASTWYSALMQDQRAPVLALQVLFALAIVATTLVWSRAVDRSRLVFDGLLVALGVATVAYAAGVFRGPVVAMLLGLMAHVATAGAARSMIWSAAGRVAVLGPGGAAALALVDATGLVGAFVAPRMVVALAERGGSVQTGLLYVIVGLVAATGLAAMLRTLARRR